MSSKTKKKHIINEDIADEITVKFILGDSKIIKEFSSSALFKIYLKSQLENKSITLPFKSDISILSYKLTYEIISYILSEKSVNTENSSFTINKYTSIIIDTSNIDIDILQQELENKLKINDNDNLDITEDNKKYLIEVLNSKIAGIINNKENIKDKVNIINHEELYKTLTTLIEFTIINNNKEKAALKLENKHIYYYKTLLISGASGSGKTNLINNLKQNYLEHNKINYFDFDIFLYSPENKDDILDKLKAIFKFSKLLTPSIIFIENIDYLFPKKDSTDNTDLNDTELNNLLSFIINQINNLPNNILIIFTATSINKLSNLIQNKIDYTINIPFPNLNERKNLIIHYLKDFNNELNENDIDTIASKTHGFLPSDIIKLLKSSNFFSYYNKSNILTLKLLEDNLSQLKPINLKEILLEIPKVKWNEIGGNKDTIKSIRQSIELPLKNPNVFKRIGITPPKGILLYGPPGCSKTLIAKALATESGLNFLAVKGPELFSKYVGDSEKAVRDIFAKAKQCSPSIIFFDEIDSMAGQRSDEGSSGSGVEDKVLCQLLNEMDGVESRENVIVFAATNRPFALDKAIIRPGRFDRLIYIHPPTKEERKEIFNIYLNKMSVDTNLNIDQLCTLSEGFSGADIKKVCMEAAMLAINNNIEIDKIDAKYFIYAVNNTKTVITKEMIQQFENFHKKTLFN